MVINPDEFNPAKYGPDGERVSKYHPKSGRRSKLNAADAQQAVYLAFNARCANNHLVEFLTERGYTTKSARANVLKALRDGWRPRG